ncbi:unnamed protein product [Gadus morhua 'NCC']
MWVGKIWGGEILRQRRLKPREVRVYHRVRSHWFLLWTELWNAEVAFRPSAPKAFGVCRSISGVADRGLRAGE